MSYIYSFFILFLYYFCLIFIISVQSVKVPGGSGKVPGGGQVQGGSGRIPVCSSFYIHPFFCGKLAKSGFVYATLQLNWLTRCLQTIRKKSNERTSEKLRC